MRLLSLLLLSACAFAADVNTFSIVAYDPVNGDWGVTVASRYFSVGAVVPWAEAGVGAIATQANVNVGYGPRGLELLRQGHSAKEVLAKLLAERQFPRNDGRQVASSMPRAPSPPTPVPARRTGQGTVKAKTGPRKATSSRGRRCPSRWARLRSHPGRLAEKLFAALKAGDDAGGDSRGKQSASMLVVRKGRGRNINNDRYLYLNVDDNPQPIPELRRLLDLNLGLLYSEKIFRLRTAGKNAEALDAAAKVARYMPTGNSFLTLGTMQYAAGEKPAALASLRKAIQLDPTVRQRFQADAPAGGRGQLLRPILEDKEFLKQVLQ